MSDKELPTSADMRVQLVSISELKPYERNARTHSANQIEEIAKSIKAFGFMNPILVDEQLGVISGHGRLLAARHLGLQSVPVISHAHLSDAEKRAYVIADNQLALNAAWDYPVLAGEVEAITLEGISVELLGFDDKDLSLIERLGAGEQSASAGTTTIGEGRFLLQIEFDSERELQQEFEAAQQRGLRCKVLT